MANRDDDRRGNYGVGFFVGVLTGLGLGAAIAVLFAPKPGRELRADVRDAAERGAEAFRKARAARAREPEREEHA